MINHTLVPLHNGSFLLKMTEDDRCIQTTEVSQEDAKAMWHVILDANDWSVFGLDKEAAKRIDAAVNFCRNLPTDWLEKHVASKQTPNVEVTLGSRTEDATLYVDGMKHVFLVAKESPGDVALSR